MRRHHPVRGNSMIRGSGHSLHVGWRVKEKKTKKPKQENAKFVNFFLRLIFPTPTLHFYLEILVITTILLHKKTDKVAQFWTFFNHYFSNYIFLHIFHYLQTRKTIFNLLFIGNEAGKALHFAPSAKLTGKNNRRSCVWPYPFAEGFWRIHHQQSEGTLFKRRHLRASIKACHTSF